MKYSKRAIALWMIFSTFVWGMPGLSGFAARTALAQTTTVAAVDEAVQQGDQGQIQDEPQDARSAAVAAAQVLREQLRAQGEADKQAARAAAEQDAADARAEGETATQEAEQARTEAIDQAAQTAHDARYEGEVAKAAARGEEVPEQTEFIPPSEQVDPNAWDGNGINDDVTIDGEDDTGEISGSLVPVIGAPPTEQYNEFNDINNEQIGDVGNEITGNSNTGENQTLNNNGDALINTGNATVQGNGITQTNLTSTNILGQDQETSTDIENTSKGIITNIFDFFGTSGFNKIIQPRGDATIDTGDVDIKINLMNLTNTNIVNSEIGQVFFEKKTDYVGDFDLDNEWRRAGWNDCPFGKCEGEFKLHNVNDSVVNNRLNVLAQSGNNEIIDANGDGIIKTGNVRVASNLINFLNTNMTAADWHLAVANFFGDWKGNLILPGNTFLDDNEESYTLFANSKVDSTNDAHVNNTIDILSDSGNNSTSDNTGDTKIETGDATANSNVSTMSNMSFTGGDWVIVFVNTFGGWDGTIVNMPEEKIGMMTKNKQLQFSSMLSNVLKGDFEKIDQDGTLLIDNDNIAELNNDIVIKALSGDNSISGNKGDATIITGDVEVLSNIINFVNTDVTGGDWYLGLINVFGHWEGDVVFGRPDLALIDLSEEEDNKEQKESGMSLLARLFGGGSTGNSDATTTTTEKASADNDNDNDDYNDEPKVNALGAGDTIKNKFRINNYGSTAAENIMLAVDFDPAHFEAVPQSGFNTSYAGQLFIPVERISGRGSRVVEYELRARPVAEAIKSHVITTVDSAQKDKDKDNNTVTKSFTLSASDISAPAPENELQEGSNDESSSNETNNNSNNSNSNSNNNTSNNANNNSNVGVDPAAAKLEVQKRHNATGTQKSGDVVHFVVTISNPGKATAYNVKATDVFRDPAGKVLNREEWNIGDLTSGKGVKVDYDVQIKDMFLDGIYTNEITVSGNTAHGEPLSAAGSASFTVGVASKNISNSNDAKNIPDNATTDKALGNVSSNSNAAGTDGNNATSTNPTGTNTTGTNVSVSGTVDQGAIERQLAQKILSSPALFKGYIAELASRGLSKISGVRVLLSRAVGDSSDELAQALLAATDEQYTSNSGQVVKEVAQEQSSPQAPLASDEDHGNTTIRGSETFTTYDLDTNPLAGLANLKGLIGNTVQVGFLALLWGVFWSIKRNFI